MALPTIYNAGTATLTAGSAAVTGQGTSWAGALQEGDLIWAAGLAVRILTVVSNTSLTLASPWPGATRTALAYEAWYTPDIVRMQATTRTLLDQLTNGNLSSEAALTGAADKVSYYTGAGAKALADFTATGRAIVGANAAVPLPPGTIAAPGLTFTGDLDTGLHSASANVVGVACAGTQTAIFTAAGFAVGKAAVVASSDNAPGVSIGSTGIIVAERTSTIMILNRVSSDGAVVQFRKDGVATGSISVTATATTYATTSDGRVKVDRKPLVEAHDVVAMIRAMKVYDFAWTDWTGAPTGERGRGFIAQDLAKVAPEMVIKGEGKPGRDADPETGKGGFTPWGVDQGKAAPYLVAALQIAFDRIDALEAKAA